MNVLPLSWLALLASSFAAAQNVPRNPAALRLHADVQELLARETRDAAMQRILARGEYRGPGTYTEQDHGAKVRTVVVCPQPKGLPMFAVFLESTYQKLGPVPLGHLITVAADGAIVRVFEGNNLVEGTFADINGDEIVERVEIMNCGVASGGTVRQLFVTPITADVEATLRIAFDYTPDNNEPAVPTAWRTVAAGDGAPARIQIGPRDPATGSLAKVAAEWQWHAERKAWVGPGGGPSQPFVRLPPVGWDGLEEFAAAQRPRDANR